MQQVQQQQDPGRPHQRQLTAARKDQTSQGGLTPPVHGLRQHRVGGAGGHAGRAQVQAAAGVEHRFDLVRIDEAVQGQGAIPGGTQALQLGLVEDEDLSGGVLIALDDGGGVERAVVWTALVVA